MIKYKLTTQNLTTYHGFQWEIGKKVTTDGSGELCGSGWLHCYDSHLLAVLLNPIHANISNPKLWECEVGGKSKDNAGLKSGYTEMSLVKEIKLPVISTTQKVAFAILVSKKVFNIPSYTKWADNWLSGKDRTELAAHAASAPAHAAAYAAHAASAPAHAAAYAAHAAAYAAHAASAHAAAYAAHAAEYAGWAGWAAAPDINLIEIAEAAMKY